MTRILHTCLLLCALLSIGCTPDAPSITARTVTVTWDHDGTIASVTGTYDLWSQKMVDVKVVGEWDERVISQFNKESDRVWLLWTETIRSVASGLKDLAPMLLKAAVP